MRDEGSGRTLFQIHFLYSFLSFVVSLQSGTETQKSGTDK